MNRSHRSLVASVLAGPLALLAGCLDNPLSIEVLQTQEVTTPGCMVMSSVATGLERGVIDVGVLQATSSHGYEVFPVVRNNIADPSMVNAIGMVTVAQRTDVSVTGVDVRLKVSGALAAAVPNNLRSFFLPYSIGAVSSGGTAGFGAEIIPRPIGILMNQMLMDGQTVPMIASFRVVANHQGETITTSWVDFPIDVCRFCLTGGLKPGVCPSAGFPKAQINAGGCSPAQDTMVTCCTGGNSQLLCGNAVPVSTAMGM